TPFDKSHPPPDVAAVTEYEKAPDDLTKKYDAMSTQIGIATMTWEQFDKLMGNVPDTAAVDDYYKAIDQLDKQMEHLETIHPLREDAEIEKGLKGIAAGATEAAFAVQSFGSAAGAMGSALADAFAGGGLSLRKAMAQTMVDLARMAFTYSLLNL